ncbi:DUF6141 family protein [Methanolobus sp. ZRKC3]|uniref:DUF6141 family protein n=1 Tax=Methanolobus sp. ZRKC3 TaxID=3125786 RepID=UPI00325395E3
MNETVFFREEQKFNQWWMQFLVLLTVVFMWYAALSQFVYGKPVGNDPASDVSMLIMWIVFGIIFPVFMYSLRLSVEVRNDGLYIQFYPFHFSPKKTPFENIRNYGVSNYRPLRDYGGWGIRYGPKGKAYTTSGTRGVLLDFTDGKRLMLGSQRADELVSAIRAAMNMVQ